jgi:hypothetical protein
MLFLSWTAELAAADGLVADVAAVVEGEDPELFALSLWWWRVPTTPPTTAPTMTRIATGAPNLSHGLKPFFGGADMSRRA